MEMTESEIKASYSHAKHKNTQIKILADLNDCSVKDIKTILGIQEEKPVKSEIEKIDEYVSMQKKLNPKHIVEVEEEPVKAAELKIPDSIYNMAVERLETLEKIIDKANAEYAEIAKFLLMGA